MCTTEFSGHKKVGRRFAAPEQKHSGDGNLQFFRHLKINKYILSKKKLTFYGNGEHGFVSRICININL